MKTDLHIEVLRSRFGDNSVRAVVTGTVGKIAVRGGMRTFNFGLDPLTPRVVDDLLTLNRAGGHTRSRSVSQTARRAVVKDLITVLQSMES